MTRFTYLLVALVLAGPAAAQDGIPEIICRLVLADVIQGGHCHHNVVCLAKTLTSEIPKFDISKAKVLYVYSETGITNRRKYSSSPVYAWNTVEALGGYGEGKAKGWDWHVIMEYEIDGVPHIIDPAYNGTPKIRRTADYFNDMFLREVDQAYLYVRNANEKIVIRSVPAETYAETFQDSRAFPKGTRGLRDQYYFMDDPGVREKYPSEKLPDFLKRR